MARIRHTAEQIVAKLRQIELDIGKGATTPVACKKAGITEQTFSQLRLPGFASGQDILS